MLQISLPTVVDWYNFIMDVCAERHLVEIGGLGIELETDESNFGRRKYNSRWQV